MSIAGGSVTQHSDRVRELPWDTGRDPAVDLVRGIAVVCMVIAHVKVWAPTEDTLVKIVLTLVNNVASPLFALVMGVSAGIVLTRSSRQVRGGCPTPSSTWRSPPPPSA